MKQAPQPSFASRHPVWTTLGVLFVLGLIIEYWWLIVAVAAGAAAAYGVLAGWRAYERREAADAQARAALAERADYEHQQFLEGDPTGLYGQYPPPPSVG